MMRSSLQGVLGNYYVGDMIKVNLNNAACWLLCNRWKSSRILGLAEFRLLRG